MNCAKYLNMTDFLPGKFTPLTQTILGRGAEVLRILKLGRVTVGQLYILLHKKNMNINYDDFVEILTFLYYNCSIVEESGVIRLENQ